MMAYKEIVRNALRTFEDLEKWLAGRKAKVISPVAASEKETAQTGCCFGSAGL